MQKVGSNFGLSGLGKKLGKTSHTNIGTSSKLAEKAGTCFYEAFTLVRVVTKLSFAHRIINDRIEKSIKGRRIGHTGERGRGLLCFSTTIVV